MLDIKEYLKQTKTVLLTQDAFDELMQRASAQPEVAKDTNVPNNDCISRRAVLAALTDISYNHCKTEGEAIVIDTAKTLVTVMPSAQPEVAKDTNVLINDCISRQAALYAIYEICNEPVAWLFRAAREIEKLPSAQPEIIRCRDCRKYRRLGCPMGITVFDAPDPDGYCYKAEGRTDEPDKQTD